MKKFCLLLFMGVIAHLTAFSQDVPQTQQIVISKIGATWCPNCGTTAWDNFTTLHNEFNDKAVILSLHPSRSSRLHSPESIELAENLPQSFGQPLFYVNRTKYATGSIVQNARQAIEDGNAAAPLANTGINATIKDGMLQVDAKVKFFQEGNGDYFLSLLIVEDGVIEVQSQRGSDANHKKLVRTAMMEGTFGQAIGSGAIAAESEFTFSDAKAIEEDWNTENLEVAAIIWQKVGDNYEVVNGNSVDASFSTSVNFLEQSGVALEIAPTLVKASATITLTTPVDFDKANVGVFNTAGQQVNTIFSGILKSGTHNYTIQRADLKASGIYFLRMEANGSVLSKKLIVE